MRIAYFAHAVASCWNNGNAHFVRGVLRELAALGHDVRAFEPADGWSRANLHRDHGETALDDFSARFPDVRPIAYGPEIDLAEAVDGCDLVVVHEWNTPDLVARLGALRRHGSFVLLFHDTHHRAVSDPETMRAYDLTSYDGVLAFGGTLAAVYRAWGWGDRAFTWHEAADTRLFHPPNVPVERRGLVWIGNWGDGERSAELHEFLLRPTASLGVPLDVYGVRYPDEALATLAACGARYHGWLANARAPEVFAQHAATVHVPRRNYVETLPGIPTIRVFEALACGIPLVCAPWEDTEHLFAPGSDFLQARDGAEMERQLRAVLNDSDLRAELVAHGLAVIRDRHTCAHRAGELVAIACRLGVSTMQAA